MAKEKKHFQVFFLKYFLDFKTVNSENNDTPTRKNNFKSEVCETELNLQKNSKSKLFNEEY